MDKNNLTISKMTIDDLNEIKDELLDNFDNLWNYEIFKEELANTNSEYLVLKNNSQIVGYAGIKVILDIADIMDIVIRSDFRGNGLSKLLLESLINLAKEKQCSQINLEVDENNTVAINLYESFKFQQVGLRKQYYKNGNNAILMTLQL